MGEFKQNRNSTYFENFMAVVREFVSYGCIVIYKNCTEDDEKPDLLKNWDPKYEWKTDPF